MATQSGLPARYEIRVLDRKYADWARAISIYSNIFHNAIGTAVVNPEDRISKCYEAFEKWKYGIEFGLDSGHSLGIFDKEYQYKRPESAATGGALYWDVTDTHATAAQLLEQMDFSLVSIALAYDLASEWDTEKIELGRSVMPAMRHVHAALAAGDKRDEASYMPTALGQVLSRNSTATRPEYEGRGLMKHLAHQLMRNAAEKGFRGIQVPSTSDAVTKVWTNPPEPFRGEVVSEFDTWTLEVEDEKGEKVFPLRPTRQRVCRVYVTLRDGED